MFRTCARICDPPYLLSLVSCCSVQLVCVQAMPHTVRVVGGKQRGHRSAFRDLSRDEAVTDASKWGLLKVTHLSCWLQLIISINTKHDTAERRGLQDAEIGLLCSQDPH